MPLTASASSARTGRLSLAKTFQMPDTSVYCTNSCVRTPQLVIIRQLRPSATVPPAGTVFATADELRLTAAAWCNRSPGRNARIITHVAARLPAVALMTSRIPGHVIAVTVCHSLP